MKRTLARTSLGWSLFGGALLGGALLGCERPSQDRAIKDREVGHSSSESIDVHVSGGLAAVRALAAGRVTLWSSAPGFELELVSHREQTILLEVENAMPAAELSSVATGTPLLAEPGDNPTKKRWEVRLPLGSLRLRLATPEASTPIAFRFALMSDVQEAIDDVQDIFQLMNAQPDLDFLLGAGDLTRRGTVEELERFQYELEALSIPYYTTLGNHELGTTPPPYQDLFGRASFQFVYRGVYFTLLDSGSATLDPLVTEWLDGWLAAGRSSVHVVAMHVPPLDPIGVRNGAFGSRAEAAALVADLAEAGVDLTLYGHIHSYYAFDNAGIPAYISGGGGAIPERFDKIGRHFMVFDVDPVLGITGARRVDVDSDFTDYDEDEDEDEGEDGD
jgi:3',5'-cyclic-AMP phosphodiesterase